MAAENKKGKKTLFDVYGEKYNNEIISLTEVVQRAIALSQAAGVDATPAISALLLKLLGGVFSTAIPVEFSMAAGLFLGNKVTPELILKTFQVISPPSISASFLAKHHFRDIPVERPVKTSPWLIEGYSFNLDEYPAFLEKEGPKILALATKHTEFAPVDPLLPGLYYGSKRSWLESDAELTASTIFAELLSRLMLNYSAFPGSPLVQRVNEADELFSVVLNGKTFYRIDDFVTELLAEADQVDSGILKSCALFGFILSYQNPLVPDAPTLDVPFTMFVQTGVVDRNTGKQAYVPMAHSAVFLRYKSAKFSFATEYYLGSGGNARFRSGCRLNLPWASPIISEHFDNEKLLQALRASSVLGNALNALAVEARLLNGGYGTNGVCADSVAPVQQLISGKTDVYPLLGLTSNKNQIFRLLVALRNKLEEILQQSDADNKFVRPVDVELVRNFPRAILNLPCDSTLSLHSYTKTLQRILDSLPWVEGNEPFIKVTKARDIIRKEIAAHQELESS